MAYRTILFELLDDQHAEARLRCGFALAERFEAELVGIHVSLPPFAPVGYGEGTAYVGADVFEAQREANRLVRERVEAAFRKACGRTRLPARDLYDEGDPGEIIADAARGADLTIAVQPEGGAGHTLDNLLRHPVDQVILSAGGPVLMLPHGGWEEAVGQRVMVAWNGSREAARAMKDALPLLVTAGTVTLVAAGEAAGDGLAAAAALLRRHAVREIAVQQVELGSAAGATLLAAARAARCDLLVMGAYGHSRLREIVLGGATREVLRDATLPVLFSC